MFSSTAFFTVTKQVSTLFPTLAVITAVPTLIPVILPLLSTFAIFSLELDQIAFLLSYVFSGLYAIFKLFVYPVYTVNVSGIDIEIKGLLTFTV